MPSIVCLGTESCLSEVSKEEIILLFLYICMPSQPSLRNAQPMNPYESMHQSVIKLFPISLLQKETKQLYIDATAKMD